MRIIHVAAAIIKDGNRILATQRGYGEFKGMWEFPGGKVKPGESAQQALLREIKEELDVEVKVGELAETVEYDYPHFHLYMECFWCALHTGKIVLKEHEAARWLTKATINSVQWLPADIELAAVLGKSLDDKG